MELKRGEVDIDPDGISVAFPIPEQAATTFLRLELCDATGRSLSDNFYWLPKQLAQLDWDRSNYIYTPAIKYADMTDLAEMPQAAIRASATAGKMPGTATLSITNMGPTVAFFLHAEAVRPGEDEEIAPVFWNDNFISLLPGETRKLEVRIPSAEGAPVEFVVGGWNLRPGVVRSKIVTLMPAVPGGARI